MSTIESSLLMISIKLFNIDVPILIDFQAFSGRQNKYRIWYIMIEYS